MSPSDSLAPQSKNNHFALDIQLLKDSLDIIDVIEKQGTALEHVKGDEYIGLCPFHDDHTPSLTVNANKQIWLCRTCPGKNGKPHLGGDVFDFLTTMGNTLPQAIAIVKGETSESATPVKRQHTDITKTLQWTHIQAPAAPTLQDYQHYKYGQPDKIYRYNNKNGYCAGYVCRFELPDGKETLPFIYAKNGNSGATEWRYLGFQNPYRPLYAADLIDANPDATVVMVEGEKCADFINEILPSSEFVATTWIGGAGQVGKTDMSQLDTRRVIFWPDNDEPGDKCMRYAASVIKSTKKRFIKIDAGLPKHWDAADSDFSENQLRDFISPPVTEIMVDTRQADHMVILEALLREIHIVNFRNLTGITDESIKIGKKHYLICTVEYILDIAQQNDWGLCKNQNFIYLYNGNYWKILDASELKDFLGEAAQKMGVDKFDAKHYVFRADLLKQFEALSNLPSPGKLKDLVLINFKNGTFEIGPEKQYLRETKREDFLTYQLGFDYNPVATAPRFEKFINTVLPDKPQQMVLAEYLGYLFLKTSTLRLEKTLLLYGSGANGKSVCFEIISAMLGEENISNYSLSSLTDNTGYYRAKLAGKLLNYGTEINGKLEADVFKQLASGEPVEARLPYGEPFTLTEYAKLMFNCNELPTSTEQTYAFFRRFIIIQFGVTIAEADQDKDLAKKIIASELPGVFNWVMEGLERLLKQRHFTQSEIIDKQVADFRTESDSVQLFMKDENYLPDQVNTIPLKDLYQNYQSYCISSGERYPCSLKTASKRLESAGYRKHRDNRGVVFYVRKQTSF
jgi:putative DNA primase/helicase